MQVKAEPDARGLRVALVVSRYNDFVTDRLQVGAIDGLKHAGAAEADIEVMAVPGAYEIPQVAKAAAATGRFDAVVCLGCLIRGETPHFDYISSAVSQGIMTASLDTGVPISFGVITADTIEQAVERAGTKAGNKGWDAANGAIEMANLLKAM